MRLDLFTQVLRRPADHQTGNEDGQDCKYQHAVQTRADPAKDHLTQLDHDQWHHATQGGEGVVHGVYRATGRRRRNNREQAGRIDSKTRFLAFHVAA